MPELPRDLHGRVLPVLTRRLALKREALSALTTDELAVFGGAAAQTTPCPTPPYYFPTMPLTYCRLSDQVCVSGEICPAA